MLAKSLNENTKLLPQIETDKQVNLSYEKSTADAIRKGVLLMTVSFVERSIKNFNEHKDKAAPLYLTGGDAEMLMQYLVFSRAQIVMPNLMLDGFVIALP